jgi:hypothetical protein
MWMNLIFWCIWVLVIKFQHLVFCASLTHTVGLCWLLLLTSPSWREVICISFVYMCLYESSHCEMADMTEKMWLFSHEDGSRASSWNVFFLKNINDASSPEKERYWTYAASLVWKLERWLQTVHCEIFKFIYEGKTEPHWDISLPFPHFPTVLCGKYCS